MATWLLLPRRSFARAARDPFAARSRIYKLPVAIVCDALKIAYATQRRGQYKDVFLMVRRMRGLLNFRCAWASALGLSARAALAAHAEILLAVERAVKPSRVRGSDPSARDFWRGRRVLLTGHTGFKGAWLWLWLRDLGREGSPAMRSRRPPRRASGSIVRPTRMPRSPRSSPTSAMPRGCATALTAADPQIVIHMAAQALVRESYSRSARNLRHQRARHRRAARRPAGRSSTSSAWWSSPATRSMRTRARGARSRRAIGSAATIRTAQQGLR